MVSHQSKLFGDPGRKWWELRLEFLQLGRPALSLWFCIFFSNNMKRDNSMPPVVLATSFPFLQADSFFISLGSTGIYQTQFSLMVQYWYLKSSKNLDIAKLPQINYHWVKGKVFVTLGMVSFLQSKQQYPSKNNQSALWVICVYIWSDP